jgi:benzoate-CoA ligase family protein
MLSEGIPASFNIAQYLVERSASNHPERIAIAGDGPSLTYGELSERTCRAGSALRAVGCCPGDRVLLALADGPAFIEAFFGASRIGGIAVPVNPASRASDFGYYSADCGASIAVVHAAALPEFSAAAETAALRGIFVVGAASGVEPGREPRTEKRPKVYNWDAELAAASPGCPAAETSARDPAFILYTSGSGGQPKGAVHQHKDMLFASRSYARDVLGLRDDDVTFSVSKLFFAYGLGNGMYFPLSAGATMVHDPERPRPSRVIEIVSRQRPTVFFSVPTFYAALLAEAKKTPADFSSVRMAISAGEPLPSEIFERFRARFGIEILDGIGSTEMLHIFIGTRPGQAKAGSCGVPVPGYEAKILDDEGAELLPGNIGNLWVRGESSFAEYWGKPELTERTKRAGWVATGDKFLQQPDGYFHYCGRADDMMKVSGMWVSPGEVENALLGHPMVVEAAVVAAQRVDGLMRPAAFVVARQELTAGDEFVRELQEFVRARLPGFKCPQEIHLVAELPKTATGKIQRFRLRSRFGNLNEGRP